MIPVCGFCGRHLHFCQHHVAQCECGAVYHMKFTTGDKTFKGSMQDIRTNQSQLSQSEIQSHYMPSNVKKQAVPDIFLDAFTDEELRLA